MEETDIFIKFSLKFCTRYSKLYTSFSLSLSLINLFEFSERDKNMLK